MLNRERIALKVLEEAGGRLPKTTFVKLVFLLRMETALKQNSSFYDFVPYKYGPYSFALYRDLYRLESHGYVSEADDSFALNEKLLIEAQSQTKKLKRSLQCAVVDIVERYGQMKLSPLIKDVYDRYRWYALNSERSERRLFPMPFRPKAPVAVYTVGYEGKSVDAFFNYLLEKGIETIIDVRANPISRKYGFSGSRMKQIGEYLGIEYQHFPSLGVASSERANLRDNGSYTRLFNKYEQHILAYRKQEVREVGKYMQSWPSVLVCVEKDVTCCHRSRLAIAVARESRLRVTHL
ncbi:MAG: DUF488 family protein [Chloroflexota bacterium]|nr:DUF488 family protein [Chloroflexota bacterium]